MTPDRGSYHSGRTRGACQTSACICALAYRCRRALGDSLKLKSASVTTISNQRDNQHRGISTVPLIQLVILLVVLGVILWAINTYIPMEATIKKILNVVVVIVAVLYVLSAFGLMGSMTGMRLGN
jgi:hypothetical protein